MHELRPECETRSPRPQNGMQTRTDRCTSAKWPKQRPWPPPARLVRPHRPLEVGDNEQSGSKHTKMTSNRYMKSHHRRSFAGELWADLPSRLCGEGLAKTCVVGVTATTALGRQYVALLSVGAQQGHILSATTRNKIEHGRILIVFGLLGHQGVVKSAITASRSRHRRRSLVTTNNCCEHVVECR